MSEYLKTVVTVVVGVSAIMVFLPKDAFSKYVNLLAGILVMAVIIMPVFNLEFEIEEFDTEILEYSDTDYVAEEFEKNLAEKIKTELRDKTGVEFFVEVWATTDEIKDIKISPYNREYAQIAARFTGVGEDKVMEK